MMLKPRHLSIPFPVVIQAISVFLVMMACADAPEFWNPQFDRLPDNTADHS